MRPRVKNSYARKKDHGNVWDWYSLKSSRNAFKHTKTQNKATTFIYKNPAFTFSKMYKENLRHLINSTETLVDNLAITTSIFFSATPIFFLNIEFWNAQCLFDSSARSFKMCGVFTYSTMSSTTTLREVARKRYRIQWSYFRASSYSNIIFIQ